MAVNFKPVWLHCNFCFDLDSDQYKITKCGIIFCGSSKCLNVVNTTSCKNCKGPCQKHFNLDDSAPRDIKHLFTDTVAQIKTIKRSEMFQKRQIASKLEADRGIISKQEMKIQKIETATEKIIDRQKKVQDEITLAEKKEEALKMEKEMIKKKKEEEALKKQRELMKKRKEEALKKHEEMLKKKEEEALQRKRQLSKMSSEAESLKRRRMEMRMEEHEMRRRMRMMKKGIPLSPPGKAQHQGPGHHSLQLPQVARGGEVTRNTAPDMVLGRDPTSRYAPPSGQLANLNLNTSNFTLPSDNPYFKSIFDI